MGSLSAYGMQTIPSFTPDYMIKMNAMFEIGLELVNIICATHAVFNYIIFSGNYCAHDLSSDRFSGSHPIPELEGRTTLNDA